jgi:O-acetyl-ADP-ribose deacetylase (regulator of RNase III)
MNVLIKGDLLDVAAMFNERVGIGHGCNCYNTMGKGVALFIKNRFPNIYIEDCKTVKGDSSKLGKFTWSDEVFNQVRNKKTICRIYNLYTQNKYWDTNDMFSIDAFRTAMIGMIQHGLNDGITKFVIPAIGMGLANGNKDEIMNVLKELTYPNTIAEQRDVTIYMAVIDKYLFDILSEEFDIVIG